MSQVKLLAFAGSTRTASFNKQLVKIAAEGAREAGAAVTLVDLRDLPMPLFDGDLEDAEGLPANAKKLKALFRENDGFLIASPEYNSSITAVLKNSIDWVSRPETDDEPSLVAFRGKTAALMSASPGGMGGLRGLVHLRSILGNIGVHLLPEQVTVSGAYEAFVDRKLKDSAKQSQVLALGKSLTEFTAKLKGAAS
jgi:chromate reductase, NAD(P)H dehydrogenase (quinone)